MSEYRDSSLLPLNDHVRMWEAAHQAQISEAASLFTPGIQAMYIEGPVFSGKTTLAWSLIQALHQRQPQNQEYKALFTTPPVQETMNAKAIVDRTGIQYDHLPQLRELELFEGQKYIVVDEISTRSPDRVWMPIWQKYFSLPHAYTFLIGHPQNRYASDWISLLPEERTVLYRL